MRSLYRFVLSFLIFASAKPALADEPARFCDRHLTQAIVRKLQPFMNADFNVTVTESVLEIESRRAGGFVAGGRLDSQGVLELVIYTREAFEPKRLPELRGREAFNLIAEYFGNRVRGIRGRWSLGDNLLTFNRESSNLRTSLQEAAARTWTGRQAARLGFTQIFILGTRGKRGNFKTAEVLFVRPLR